MPVGRGFGRKSVLSRRENRRIRLGKFILDFGESGENRPTGFRVHGIASTPLSGEYGLIGGALFFRFFTSTRSSKQMQGDLDYAAVLLYVYAPRETFGSA